MNPVSKLSPPVVPDPFLAEVIAQLKEQVSAQQRVISEKDARLATYAMHVQKLEEELRLERIKRYGKQSEKLSDLQLELLDREPAVASEEIATEAAAGPLPQPEPDKDGEPARKRKPHPGRNPLPAHLKRVKRLCRARRASAGAASVARRPR